MWWVGNIDGFHQQIGLCVVVQFCVAVSLHHPRSRFSKRCNLQVKCAAAATAGHLFCELRTSVHCKGGKAAAAAGARRHTEAGGGGANAHTFHRQIMCMCASFASRAPAKSSFASVRDGENFMRGMCVCLSVVSLLAQHSLPALPWPSRHRTRAAGATGRERMTTNCRLYLTIRYAA